MSYNKYPSKRIFTACLNTETNFFSPVATTIADFREVYYVVNGKHPVKPHYKASPMIKFAELSSEAGYDYYESLCAIAGPAGIMSNATYEHFRDKILGDLKQLHGQSPIDAVLLHLHGAMAATDYEDCEGDLLQDIRKIIGKDIPIGIELDLHANITHKMLQNTTFCICYKKYPHIDLEERAEDLFNLVKKVLQKEINPVTVAISCHMMGVFPTDQGAMQKYMEQINQLECDPKVLSISVAHGFPWADISQMGAMILVTTNNDEDKAKKLAINLAKNLWQIRKKITPVFYTVDQVLKLANEKSEQPFILADFADNAGGGAPSDATYILEEMLTKQVKNVALGCFWAPDVVTQAIEAGIGAEIPIELGGTTSLSGNKLKLTVKVTNIQKKFNQPFKNFIFPMGDTVALKITDRNIDLIICSIRKQVYSVACFTSLGIDVRSKKFLVVKSSAHFREEFSKISEKIFTISSPGALSPIFKQIPYKKLPRPMWPIDNENDTEYIKVREESLKVYTTVFTSKMKGCYL